MWAGEWLIDWLNERMNEWENETGFLSFAWGGGVGCFTAVPSWRWRRAAAGRRPHQLKCLTEKKSERRWREEKRSKRRNETLNIIPSSHHHPSSSMRSINIHVCMCKVEVDYCRSSLLPGEFSIFLTTSKPSTTRPNCITHTHPTKKSMKCSRHDDVNVCSLFSILMYEVLEGHL